MRVHTSAVTLHYKLGSGPVTAANTTLDLRVAGRATGLLGPGCSTDDVRLWLTAQGVDDVTLEVSGPMGYFRGVKA